MTSHRVGVFRLQLFKTSETFIAAQANRLRRYAPVFIGRAAFGPAPPGVEVITAPLGRLTQLRLALLRDMSSLEAGVRQAGVEVLHSHFAVDAIYGQALAKRMGLPHAVTLHGFDVTRSDASFLKSMRPALINAVLFRRRLQASGATFLCVSDFIRKRALARGFPEASTHLHYLGIDVEKLAPDDTVAEPDLIVHVARLVEKKGTRYLIDAVALLAQDGVRARLAILGDGPLRAELEAHAARAGVADQVQFLGSCTHPEVIRWIRRASAVAVPSVTARSGDEEGLPTVVLEAGALGRPVVACDAGGTAEAIIDGQTGYVLPQRDPKALAGALHVLLTDPSARQAMGEAARRHILEHFDMRTQTALLEDVYDSLRGQGVNGARP
ncbi:MAG TPA: glycosyltransferase [Caulobacteraceae bacterium]|nr:glycosyltransferase [Caulobacteraceae bacterium]